MAVFLCLLLLAQPVDAQEAVFDVNGVAREVVVDQRVRTIMLYREGWESSYPILTFSEELPLVLEFDELSDEVGDFYYTVLHCDADWIPSELLPQEYIDGYDENRIEDYENSFNTYTNYTHFRLTLPNNDMRLTRSGNYLLVVFRDGDREEVVFSRRFLLSEAAVTIDAQVNRPVMSSFRDCCHEIDLVIRHGGYRIDDPFNETTLSIYQNGVWDNAIHDLQPRFINPGELVYDYQRENVFNAGNEFRMFDTRNTRVRAYHISNIEFISSTMHYELKEDAPNPPHLYFDREDMNGRYHIGNAEGRDPSVDADYGFVHFTLQSPFEMANGDIYITGALTNWQFTESNRMKFDEEAAAYRGTLFLKQGLYNYRYIFLPDDTSTFDLSEIEGSHYETKNDYVILFYHRPMGERYDRLVGHQVARSGS
jgi:hypothetical protein